MKFNYLLIIFIFAIFFTSNTSKAQAYNPDLIFGVPGMNGEVFCSAASGTDLYIGGSFSQAGSIKANNIVKWNGLNWDTLGAGIVGTVKALLVKGDDLYVGGEFSIPGQPNVGNLAKWNITTKQWSPVGSQSLVTGNFNACISTFALDGDFIYMGGRFSFVNSINNLGSIIKYNTLTDTWIDIGGFVDVTAPIGHEANVNQILINNGLVYIAGDYTNVNYAGGGGAACNTVMEYNGTTFTNVGSNNITPRVRSICFDGNQLYAAGSIINIKPVVMLSAGAWVAVNNQMPAYVSEVNSLAVYNNEIYAGANGSTTQNIAMKWNGTQWSSVNRGINTNTVSNNSATRINSFQVTANGIYAFGSFLKSDGYTCNNAAFFNGSQWRVLGNTIWGAIRVLKQKGNDIYAGGNFTIAGSDTVNNIARWDGFKWNTMDKGVTGGVYAIAFKGDTVFAGGDFTKAGNITTTGIAYWVNNTWHEMAGGFPSLNVNDIEVVGDNVYVGGGNVMLWKDNSWKSMGKLNGTLSTGVDGGIVTDLETGPDGSLYIAGDFTTACGIAVNGITRWDGRDFHALGGGFPVSLGYHVYALKTYGKNIFVAGYFSDAAGVANTQNIAYWNGASWNSAGNADGRILGLETDGISLYASGAFNSVNSVPAKSIAAWNGVIWKPVLSATVANSLLSDYIGNYQHKLAVTCNSLWVPGVAISHGIVKIDKTPCTETLKLISPTGNESWMMNSQKIISWNFAGVNTLKIEYSTDGGSNWLSIATALPAYEKNYLWTVPAVSSTNMLVKITSEQNNTVSDISTAFSTNNNSSISFLGPDGGESFYTSCSIPLYWKSINVTNVKIDYREKDNNGTLGSWRELAIVPAGTGVYDWKIPSNNTNYCQIRTTNTADAAVSDSSGLYFQRFYSSSCPALTLNTPSATNLNYMVGATVSMNWSTQNLSLTNVKLELSTDNGATWSIISSNVTMVAPSFGSFSWTVPNTPSANCLVRVSDLTDPSYSDISDNNFSISVPNVLTVLSPNGGENYMVGDAHTVTWNYQGADQGIYIYLKFSSANPVLIGSYTAAAESFAYTVPNNISGQCRMLIYYSNFSFADSSNGNFSIVAAGATPLASFTSPAANATIQANSNVLIQWEASNATNVTLQYSTDAGANWTDIATSIPANNMRVAAIVNGQYQWTVPNLPAQSIKLRIKDGSSATVFHQITVNVSVATGVSGAVGTAEELMLFPNPGNDYVNFEYSKGILKAEVYTLAGVKIEESGNDLSGISLGHLNQSMYIIKVFTVDQRVFIKQFVKE